MSDLKKLDDNKQKIKDEVIRRKIPYLVHFTHENNILSILKNGLIPRTKLEEDGIEFTYNDPIRAETLKYKLDFKGVCLSIAHPNTYLLEKFRRDKQLMHRNVVILRLNSKILWEKNVLFCETNAAKKGYNLGYSYEHFCSLFNPTCGGYSREEGLADYFPTNIQAELICVDIIEPSYFLDIVYYKNSKISLHTVYNGKIGNEYVTNYPFILGERQLEYYPLIEEIPYE